MKSEIKKSQQPYNCWYLCFLRVHWVPFFSSIGKLFFQLYLHIHSIRAADVVSSLLGLLVKGSRKTTFSLSLIQIYDLRGITWLVYFNVQVKYLTIVKNVRSTVIWYNNGCREFYLSTLFFSFKGCICLFHKATSDSRDMHSAYQECCKQLNSTEVYWHTKKCSGPPPKAFFSFLFYIF